MSTVPIKVDRAEIIRALTVILEPAQVTELRAIGVTSGSYRTPHTVSGYFNDYEKLAEAVAAIPSAQGIYFIPDVPNPALLARAANRARQVGKEPTTGDGDIVRRRWLKIDCDPVRPAGISSTDAEHKDALDRAGYIAAALALEDWPTPIFGDSGNGAHLLYRIDLPPNDDGLHQHCLEALNSIFGTESVKVDLTTFNPSRIWKLYGTLSGKGDSIPDRPHRLAKLISIPDSVQIVPVDLLKQLAAQAPSQSQPTARPANGHRFNGESTDPREWLEKWISDFNVPVGAGEPYADGLRYRFNQCPFNGDHGKNDAAIVIRSKNNKIGFHCFHNGCSGRDWSQLREIYDPESRRKPAPQRNGHANGNGHNGNGSHKASTSPVLIRLSDVESRKVDWLWNGRIPAGRATLMVGRPGEGKSFVTMDFAARVSTGTPWPDGEACPKGSVILISGEDDPRDTLRPRLDAHDADTSKIHLLSMKRLQTADGKTQDVMFTLDDVATLENAIQEVPDCKLIIIDPIGSFIGAKTDAHRDNEVRGVLAPVIKLAEKYGPAILIVAHRRKAGGSVADDLAMGSRAFTGIARAVWHLGRDKQDKTRRLLLPGKNNLAAEGTGLGFTILGDPPSIVWERDPVRMNADDALAEENESGKPGPEPAARNAAEEWLRAELADFQEHRVDALKEAVKEAGMGSWKTVQRAAREIGVKYHRASYGGGYVWRIPRPVALQDKIVKPAIPVQDTLQDTLVLQGRTCPPVPQGETPRKEGYLLVPGDMQDKLISSPACAGAREGQIDASTELEPDEVCL